MKKLFYLFMVAMCATMFTACSDDDKDPLDDDGEGKEGVITMTLEETYIHLGVETFKEGEIVTVDWGDGNVDEFKSFKVYKDWDEDGEDEIHYVLSTDDIEHEYSNKNPHIVTIKGNIKGLDCYYNNLTSLNVSKNTALTYLDCFGNELTSSALNQIFEDLPQGKTWTEKDNGNEREMQSTIEIRSNPGTEDCDKSIAENKGWKVID